MRVDTGEGAGGGAGRGLRSRMQEEEGEDTEGGHGRRTVASGPAGVERTN